LHRFFEHLLEYTGRPQGVTQYRDDDWDNFKFFAHELFTCSVAIFIRFERFEFVSILTTRQYVLPKSIRESGNEPVGGFDVLNQHISSLDARKQRLNSKANSLRADKLIERTGSSIIKDRELCQADFVLYVKCEILNSRWYPHTRFYIGEHGGAFELFARACSTEYFKRVMRQVFNITDTEQLKAVAANGITFSTGFSRLDPARLMGIGRLATKS
jgi:hypothetical protein